MEQGASPENPWVFSLQTNNPSNAKRKAYTILHDDVWESSEFKRMNNSLIGTHSLRKQIQIVILTSTMSKGMGKMQTSLNRIS